MDKFCPIIKSDCRSDCAWRVHDECAIHVIGRNFMDVRIDNIPEETCHPLTDEEKGYITKEMADKGWKSQPIDTEAEIDEKIQNSLG